MAIMNQVKTVLLLGALTGLMLGVGQLFGGRQGLFIALIFVLLFNFVMYWFSDRIVLMMYRAKPVTRQQAPKLYKIVAELCKDANIPVPPLYIIPSETPNAFATGRNPKHAAVACTEGILKLLSEEELKGVLAHEISHVKNRDILITTIASTIAGIISYLAMMARWAAIFGGVGGRDRDDSGGLIGLIALTVLAPLIALVLQLALSRSREYQADASGAALLKDGKPLASALQKLETGVKHNPMRFGSPSTANLFIVNPFSTTALVSLFSTHPPMPQRIQRLKNLKF